MAFSQADNQALLDRFFGPGVIHAGGGAGEAALATAPQAVRDAYTQARRGFADQTNYSPTLPAAYSGGVAPVGQVEPLNDWQKTALTNQFNGPTPMGYMNGAQTAFDGAQTATNNLPGPLTDQQYRQYYQRYFNPYTQDVVNQTNKTIQLQGEMQKVPLKQILAGNNSFGSTAQGIESGKIDEATLRAIADSTANLNSQGFNAATSNANAGYNTDVNNAYNKVGAFTNLANLGYAGNAANRANFAFNVGNQLNAGNQVQQQNQNLLDVARGQTSQVQQYPYNNLSQYSNLFQPFTGSSGAQYNYTGSPLSQLGGLGIFAGAGGFGNLGSIG